MKYLLDTHIWLWSLLEPSKLARNIQDVLRNRSHAFFISPITVWETLILAEKGRITLHLPPDEWIQAALTKSPVQEISLTHAIAIKSRLLTLPHEDPADRFIAATAWEHNLILITEDRFLKTLSHIRILSSDSGYLT